MLFICCGLLLFVVGCFGRLGNVHSSEYEHFVRRIDSVDAGKIKGDLKLSKSLVVVTHREAYIGCRNFEQYLSPHWETLFLFNEEYAQHWKLEELVQEATKDVSLGAHLFIVSPYGGEFLGRRTALKFLELEKKDRDIEFILSCNCDQHPIPENHRLHKSMEENLFKMEHDFIRARELRQTGLLPVENLFSDDEKNGYGILAMNAILWEEFNDLDHLKNDFHGEDVGGWLAKGGVDGKPEWLKWLPDTPWVYDVSTFTESHLLLFDRNQLTKIYDGYFIEGMELHSFPSETHVIGRIANLNGLTILRNNDVHWHCDFVHHMSDLDKYPDYVDKDWVRMKNYELMANIRNPIISYRIWHQFHNATTAKTGLIWGAGVLAKQQRRSWYPAFLKNGTLIDDYRKIKFFDSMMLLFGYKRISSSGSLSYQMVGAFPSNLYLVPTYDKDYAYSLRKHYLQFLRLETSEDQALRVLSCRRCGPEYTINLPLEKRIVRFPLDSTVALLNNPVDFGHDIGVSGATEDLYNHPTQFISDLLL